VGTGEDAAEPALVVAGAGDAAPGIAGEADAVCPAPLAPAVGPPGVGLSADCAAPVGGEDAIVAAAAADEAVVADPDGAAVAVVAEPDGPADAIVAETDGTAGTVVTVADGNVPRSTGGDPHDTSASTSSAVADSRHLNASRRRDQTMGERVNELPSRRRRSVASHRQLWPDVTVSPV
jgi:hypothetical protein